MGNNMPTKGGGMNPMNALMQMLGGGGNPQQMLQMAMQRNPQFNAVINQVQQSGMSWKDFTMNYAKQHNIDINPMLDAMKKRGWKP